MQQDQIAHLAGAFDVGGNITVKIDQADRYKIGYRMLPLLSFTRPSDKDPILGKLMSYCSEQVVRYRLMETSNDGAKLHITDPNSVENFLDPFREYLVTMYLESEVMLQEVLPAIRDDQHKTKEGFYELMGAVDELRASNKGRDPKYTKTYFAKRWSLSK
jgi:5-methylcytosine-specific restriction protein A